MIRLLLFVVVLILVVRLIMRFFARRVPVITTTAQGIFVHGTGVKSVIGWDEIRQIDVSRMPTAVVDDFAVVLFGNSTVTLYDSYRGFEKFARAMFEHWPEIRAEWVRVQGGPPDISERITVWERKVA